MANTIWTAIMEAKMLPPSNDKNHCELKRHKILGVERKYQKIIMELLPLGYALD